MSNSSKLASFDRWVSLLLGIQQPAKVYWAINNWFSRQCSQGQLHIWKYVQCLCNKFCSPFCLFHAGFVLGLLLKHEDGGNIPAKCHLIFHGLQSIILQKYKSSNQTQICPYIHYFERFNIGWRDITSKLWVHFLYFLQTMTNCHISRAAMMT